MAKKGCERRANSESVWILSFCAAKKFILSRDWELTEAERAAIMICTSCAHLTREEKREPW